eukprot:1373093-Amphidinium_carterae.1
MHLVASLLRPPFHNLHCAPPLEVILRRCCELLQLNYTGKERLLYQSDWVPRGARVTHWPFSPPCGEVTDYQLLRD